MERIKEVQVTLRPYVEASKRVEGRNVKDIKFYSRDTNSSYIRFIFEKNDGTPLLLDDSYKVTVMLRFSSDDSTHTAYPSIEEDGTALYYFDANLITAFDHVEVFVYLERGDMRADIYSFTIKVDLSEADKKSGGERVPIIRGQLFTQSVASDHWVIHHSMDKYPSVTIADSSRQVVEGADITYISKSKIEVFFSAPFSGKAFLN